MGSLGDFSLEAERVEANTLSTLLCGVEEAYQASHRAMVVELPGGTVVTSVDGESSGFWNRVIGLGVLGTVTAASVSDAITVLREHGTGGVVHVIAGQRPDDWDAISAAHDLRLSSSWYKLGCEVDSVAHCDSELQVRAIETQEIDLAVTVLSRGFSWPVEELHAIYGSALRCRNLTGYGAWDGDEMVAAAALRVDGAVGHLYGAATLPAHRGRGAQSALLALRAQAAKAAGCRRLISETWIPGEGNHNSSLNNMRNSGLEVLHVRENWRL
ncbi:GNAT superfamily N-acetyltransferase [Streptomyces sp. LBL]|uniref:GNAT family N-acetyltransferase n=1 Tax=Streptomyces sp. LBL TaxID=2940562 RepID=UPI002474E0D2|nr:GNAT family N-acetyltransferase [Streptomyces sp. LBL]MDH6630546.1 GNAT superfamily N-acetyltransferase [Streptomyces sp. LBL]